MVRENMRSPRAELMTTLVRPIFTRTRKKLQGFVSGFDSRLAIDASSVHGGLAQMAERSLRMRQARGSMPLSSTLDGRGPETTSDVAFFLTRPG